MLQDELLQIEHRQSFYEQHPHINKGASFGQTFGNYAGEGLVPNSVNASQNINKQLQALMSIQSINATPWERFLTMDPSNEQSSMYGKSKMAAIGLRLGSAASVEARVQAAASLATRTGRGHGRYSRRRIKSTKDGERVRKGSVSKETIPNLASKDEFKLNGSNAAVAKAERKRHISRRQSNTG